MLIYEDPEMNSIYNHFDSDPWFVRKKELITGFTQEVQKEDVAVYPNPTRDQIIIESIKPIDHVKIFGSKGDIVLWTTNNKVDVSHFESGIYVLSVYYKSGDVVNTKILIN